MKARKDNKNLKIICATSVSIFSLLAVFMGTIAWFGANRLIRGGNEDINIVSPNGIFKQLTFHKLVSNAYIDTLYSFDQSPLGTITVSDWNYKTTEFTPAEGESEHVAMDQYSILEHRHPMLLLIELDKAYDINEIKIVLEGSTETTAFVGDKTKATLLQEGNPLSSIIRFASYGYTEGALEATKGTYSSETVSNTNVFQFAKPTDVDFRSFVNFNVEEEGETLDYKFIKSFNLYSSNVDSSKTIATEDDGSTIKIKYLPIIMDYHDEALEYIYSAYLGQEILDQDIFYDRDWELKI